MTTPAVTFDYAVFLARYPEFAGLSETQCLAYFGEAGLYCDNTVGNPAWPSGTLPTLLNMVTAHIAWLNSPRDPQGNPAMTGSPASPIVGRISSASEGSVSVSAEMQMEPGSPAWWNQTKYGAAWWEATKQYRTARYVTRPLRGIMRVPSGRNWPFA